jgi:hypothetical protein
MLIPKYLCVDFFTNKEQVAVVSAVLEPLYNSETDDVVAAVSAFVVPSGEAVVFAVIVKLVLV